MVLGSKKNIPLTEKEGLLMADIVLENATIIPCGTKKKGRGHHKTRRGYFSHAEVVRTVNMKEKYLSPPTV